MGGEGDAAGLGQERGEGDALGLELLVERVKLVRGDRVRHAELRHLHAQPHPQSDMHCSNQAMHQSAPPAACGIFVLQFGGASLAPLTSLQQGFNWQTVMKHPEWANLLGPMGRDEASVRLMLEHARRKNKSILQKRHVKCHDSLQTRMQQSRERVWKAEGAAARTLRLSIMLRETADWREVKGTVVPRSSDTVVPANLAAACTAGAGAALGAAAAAAGAGAVAVLGPASISQA